MIITIKVKEWTVKVYDADSKSEWTYKVIRGNPTLSDVSRKLYSILKNK